MFAYSFFPPFWQRARHPSHNQAATLPSDAKIILHTAHCVYGLHTNDDPTLLYINIYFSVLLRKVATSH